GAHARLRQLEQNGGDAADEYGHRIAEHTPTHGIGTKDAGIAGRLEIINVLSASWRIGQAQDHSLQTYPRRTQEGHPVEARNRGDRKSTRLNSSHVAISYAVFCLK